MNATLSPTRCAFVAPIVLLIAALAAPAQAVELPKELSGRWSLVKLNRSDLFSLGDIVAKPDGSFAARLTWWTTDKKCMLRDEPLTGTVTATGISFDAKTKCDVEFSAVLDRGDSEWLGQATIKSGGGMVVELKAK